MSPVSYLTRCLVITLLGCMTAQINQVEKRKEILGPEFLQEVIPVTDNIEANLDVPEYLGYYLPSNADIVTRGGSCKRDVTDDMFEYEDPFEEEFSNGEGNEASFRMFSWWKQNNWKKGKEGKNVKKASHKPTESIARHPAEIPNRTRGKPISRSSIPVERSSEAMDAPASEGPLPAPEVPASAPAEPAPASEGPLSMAQEPLKVQAAPDSTSDSSDASVSQETPVSAETPVDSDTTGLDASELPTTGSSAGSELAATSEGGGATKSTLSTYMTTCIMITTTPTCADMPSFENPYCSTKRKNTAASTAAPASSPISASTALETTTAVVEIETEDDNSTLPAPGQITTPTTTAMLAAAFGNSTLVVKFSVPEGTKSPQKVVVPVFPLQMGPPVMVPMTPSNKPKPSSPSGARPVAAPAANTIVYEVVTPYSGLMDKKIHKALTPSREESNMEEESSKDQTIVVTSQEHYTQISHMYSVPEVVTIEPVNNVKQIVEYSARNEPVSQSSSVANQLNMSNNMDDRPLTNKGDTNYLNMNILDTVTAHKVIEINEQHNYQNVSRNILENTNQSVPQNHNNGFLTWNEHYVGTTPQSYPKNPMNMEDNFEKKEQNLTLLKNHGGVDDNKHNVSIQNVNPMNITENIQDDTSHNLSESQILSQVVQKNDEIINLNSSNNMNIENMDPFAQFSTIQNYYLSVESPNENTRRRAQKKTNNETTFPIIFNDLFSEKNHTQLTPAQQEIRLFKNGEQIVNENVTNKVYPSSVINIFGNEQPLQNSSQFRYDNSQETENLSNLQKVPSENQGGAQMTKNNVELMHQNFTNLEYVSPLITVLDSVESNENFSNNQNVHTLMNGHDNGESKPNYTNDKNIVSRFPNGHYNMENRYNWTNDQNINIGSAKSQDNIGSAKSQDNIGSAKSQDNIGSAKSQDNIGSAKSQDNIGSAKSQDNIGSAKSQDNIKIKQNWTNDQSRNGMFGLDKIESRQNWTNNQNLNSILRNGFDNTDGKLNWTDYQTINTILPNGYDNKHNWTTNQVNTFLMNGFSNFESKLDTNKQNINTTLIKSRDEFDVTSNQNITNNQNTNTTAMNGHDNAESKQSHVGQSVGENPGHGMTLNENTFPLINNTLFMGKNQSLLSPIQHASLLTKSGGEVPGQNSTGIVYSCSVRNNENYAYDQSAQNLARQLDQPRNSTEVNGVDGKEDKQNCNNKQDKSAMLSNDHGAESKQNWTDGQGMNSISVNSHDNSESKNNWSNDQNNSTMLTSGQGSLEDKYNWSNDPNIKTMFQEKSHDNKQNWTDDQNANKVLINDQDNIQNKHNWTEDLNTQTVKINGIDFVESKRNFNNQNTKTVLIKSHVEMEIKQNQEGPSSGGNTGREDQNETNVQSEAPLGTNLLLEKNQNVLTPTAQENQNSTNSEQSSSFTNNESIIYEQNPEKIFQHQYDNENFHDNSNKLSELQSVSQLVDNFEIINGNWTNIEPRSPVANLHGSREGKQHLSDSQSTANMDNREQNWLNSRDNLDLLKNNMSNDAEIFRVDINANNLNTRTQNSIINLNRSATVNGHINIKNNLNVNPLVLDKLQEKPAVNEPEGALKASFTAETGLQRANDFGDLLIPRSHRKQKKEKVRKMKCNHDVEKNFLNMKVRPKVVTKKMSCFRSNNEVCMNNELIKDQKDEPGTGDIVRGKSADNCLELYDQDGAESIMSYLLVPVVRHVRKRDLGQTAAGNRQFQGTLAVSDEAKPANSIKMSPVSHEGNCTYYKLNDPSLPAFCKNVTCKGSDYIAQCCARSCKSGKCSGDKHFYQLPIPEKLYTTDRPFREASTSVRQLINDTADQTRKEAEDIIRYIRDVHPESTLSDVIKFHLMHGTFAPDGKELLKALKEAKYQMQKVNMEFHPPGGLGGSRLKMFPPLGLPLDVHPVAKKQPEAYLSPSDTDKVLEDLRATLWQSLGQTKTKPSLLMLDPSSERESYRIIRNQGVLDQWETIKENNAVLDKLKQETESEMRRLVELEIKRREEEALFNREREHDLRELEAIQELIHREFESRKQAMAAEDTRSQPADMYEFTNLVRSLQSKPSILQGDSNLTNINFPELDMKNSFLEPNEPILPMMGFKMNKSSKAVEETKDPSPEERLKRGEIRPAVVQTECQNSSFVPAKQPS